MKSLFERMAAANVTLESDGDNLAIVAPGPMPPDLLTDLRAVRGDLLEAYRERAAIMEFDGEMSRENAEASAARDMPGTLGGHTA